MTARDDEDRKAKDAAFNEIMGDIYLPEPMAPNYDAWIFEKSWKAALIYARQKHEAERALLAFLRDEYGMTFDASKDDEILWLYDHRAQQQKEPGDGQ